MPSSPIVVHYKKYCKTLPFTVHFWWRHTIEVQYIVVYSPHERKVVLRTVKWQLLSMVLIKISTQLDQIAQEPVPKFLNFKGAQESILWRAGRTTLFLLGS
jgi:hypothetical protein